MQDDVSGIIEVGPTLFSRPKVLTSSLDVIVEAALPILYENDSSS